MFKKLGIKSPPKMVIKLAKLGLVALVFYYLSQNIELDKTLSYFASSDVSYLLAAVVLDSILIFLIALRTTVYLQASGFGASWRKIIPYTYSGLFLNFVLPGGTGMDGYVAYKSNKNFGAPYTRMFRIYLASRGGGLFMLNFWLIFFYVQSGFYGIHEYANHIIFGLFALQFPVYFICAKYIFQETLKTFLKTAPINFLIQFLAVAQAYMIFKAIGITANEIEYMFIHIIGIILSFMPITPLGLGLRELVYFQGAEMLGLNSELAVATSLVIYLVFIASAVIGLIFYFRTDKFENLKTVYSKENKDGST